MTPFKKIKKTIFQISSSISQWFYKYFLSVSLGILLGFIISSYFSDQIALVIGVVGTLLGVSLGWFFTKYDEKKLNISNANKVLLIISKQMNEFYNIQAYFEKDTNDNKRHLKTRRFSVGESKWRLSKNDVCNLLEIDSDNEGLINIVYDLMLLDSHFHGLLFSIQDFNKCKEEIENRIKKSNQIDNIYTVVQFTPIESFELEFYLKAIDNRIKKLNFNVSNELRSFLKKFYSGQRFVKGILKTRRTDEGDKS